MAALHTTACELPLSRCAHCGTVLGAGAVDRYCCRGCERVHHLIQSAGLDRYYDLRGERGVPVPAGHGPRDRAWLEPLVAGIEAASGLHRVAVDVGGLHCAACVWVIDELFRRRPHGRACVVNPSRGRIELTVEKGFPLADWVADVEALGYSLGPALKERSRRADDLTLRMGISVALAMNTMVLALAVYLGLSEGPVYELVRQLSFALAAATVLIGGSVFIRAAWQSARRGLLHLDLPIALGIVLAFAGSTWSFFTRSGAEYFDTLAIFVALMLVGRWLQERVVADNRDRLLASDEVEGLWTRRVEGDTAALTRCVELHGGDRLLLAPGDLVPVDATLAAPARLRLDWINGESEPRAFAAGDIAPAGAFHAGTNAVQAECRTDFADSALVELLAAPPLKDEEGPAARFWDRVARFYVLGVLVAAAGAFVLWMAIDGDPQRALAVTTAVLVVTCPCAFGIAVPLARELVQAALRRTGLFVRRGSLLERAPAVRRVVFDKTGTLTTGAPELVDASALDALEPDDRAALYDLAARSTHPKSAAVLAALGNGTLDPSVVVHEETSCGLSAQLGGHLYRLGRPDWAAPSAHLEGADLVFAKDGRPLAALATREAVRADAKAELAALARADLETWILSGDAPAKVEALAAELGVPPARGVGGQSARDKAAWLRAHGADETLFVGDGINDSFAADAALAAGTPAVDRPFMPARSDFYFVTPGLAPIRRLLESSAKLRRVVRADLAFAVAYNAAAVVLAYAGLVAPWVAAVLMPLSSLSTLTYTTLALGRSEPWKS